MPGGRLRVLMVTSLPPGRDRGCGVPDGGPAVAGALDAVRGEVDLTVLRPPTFDALRQALKRAAGEGKPFHVVHFDGHGVMPGRYAGGGAVVGGRAAMMIGAGPSSATSPGTPQRRHPMS